jgi:RNA polymerase sigma-32 factor
MQHAWTISRGAASYSQEIRRFPVLKAEEELMLVVRWRTSRDEGAAHQLLTSHLRFVAKIARGYRGYGLATSDLISEGNIGLIQALQRFDPDRGVRFSTYAGWWIKAAIQAYILSSWSLVKMGTTVSQRRLFFNLSKMKQRLLTLRDGDLRTDEVTRIANGLDVSEQDVVEMNGRLSGDVSLNALLSVEGDSIEWQDRLVDECSDQESRLAENDESAKRRSALDLALRTLDTRERYIFEARRLIDPPLSPAELATKFGVSRERIRQIEMRAFKRVQEAVHAASAWAPNAEIFGKNQARSGARQSPAHISTPRKSSCAFLTGSTSR